MVVLRHVGIVSQDIERSKLFWSQQMGFECFWDKEEPSPYISNLLGFDAAGLRTVKLLSVRGDVVELLNFRSRPRPRSFSLKRRLTSAGLSHIALTVDNIDGIIRTMAKNGYRTLSKVLDSPGGSVRVVYVSGPDDVFLELVEEV